MDCADSEIALAALLDVHPKVEYSGALQLHLFACDACRKNLMGMIVLCGVEKIARDLFLERAHTKAKTVQGPIL